MSKRDPLILVEDIMLAVQKIARYTSQMDRDAFFQNELVVDGVARNLEIIGEAAANYQKSLGAFTHKSPGRR